MMRITALRLVIATAALLGGAATEAPGDETAPPLVVYCPPRMTVSGTQLTLEHVAVLSSEDADLYVRASRVAMGRGPWQGETMTIDRRTILSRLSACGIRPERVVFRGAEQTRVGRGDRLIGAEQMLAAAHRALPPGRAADGATWRVGGHPKPIAVPADAEVQLKAELSADRAAGRAEVTVSAVRDDETLDARQVRFTARYRVRCLVAGTDLPAGSVLTPANTEIRTVEKTSPQEPGWQPPYGHKLTRSVEGGTVIRPALLARARLEVAVKRNDPVMMKITGEGFVISAVALALEDGRPGEFIRVRNVDSRRVVTAKVAFDGTVEPVVEK
ncbi:MAG: flagellar basal body P-ring formation chaperone FlgA [Planctomycetota bacterium]